MRTKFLAVKDAGTLYHCLLLQFEPADRSFSESAGFDTGLKVVLLFYRGAVSCLSGYEFRDDRGGTIEELSCPFPRNGTTTSFKEIIQFVDDITRLPDVIDVEAFRHARIPLLRRHFVLESVRDILVDQEPAQLRKVLYRWGAMAHVAVVDLGTKSVLVDQSSTDLEHLVAEYLWIPLVEARPDEVRDVNLCPFRYELI